VSTLTAETSRTSGIDAIGVQSRPPLSDTATVVALILGWKAFTFFVAFVAWSVLPFNHAMRNANLRWGERDDGSFAAALSTWDSQHYIRIAEVGYEPGLLTNAFGPLYPWLIRALNVVTGDSIVSGLLISNIASGLALYLLYRFVRRRFGSQTAWRMLIIFLAFPTAFYLNLLYTDGLFLLLLVAFFAALYQRRTAIAAVCCFLLPLLRLPGLVVALPLVWELLTGTFQAKRGGRDPHHRPSNSPSPKSERGLGGEVLPLLALLTGLLVYLGYMHLELDNAFVAMDTEKLYISHRSLENLLQPWRLIEDLVRTDLVWHNYLDSAMDRAFFVVLVASLPLVWRKTDVPLALLATVMVLQPFLGSFMSYTRLTIMAFPVYIAWASLLEGRDRRLLYLAAAPMLVLQVVLLSKHVTGDWVA
jgi:hypothetical protein